MSLPASQLPSWTALPLDLLRLVFAQLPPHDLITTAAVSRTWCRAASADAIWAVHLAKLLHDRYLRSMSPEVLLAMRADPEGTLAPIGLRAHYLLCKAMRDAAHGRMSLYLKTNNPLYAVRDAMRLGIDPFRHSAPTWLNAARLQRVWLAGGSSAVAAVATVCSRYGTECDLS